MRMIIIASSALLILTGCNNTQKGAVVGGVGGAAIGAAITGSGTGAALGGLAGATAGALIGRASERGKCRYRDRRGRIYTARC